ncbi:hypothetical protein N1851_007684 [Merluccius polli]|uniref:Uncharacterized protein n=1 Tax=Merluccius polli TaxID=89951 RepID=A0AA47N3H8_MERPO|nr:hypothetical protein N1851_007684 [Merluccius polli]
MRQIRFFSSSSARLQTLEIKDQGGHCGLQERGGGHSLTINGTGVERVDNFKYLGVNIHKDQTWTSHTTTAAFTTCYGSCTSKGRKRLGRVRRIAQHITGCELPNLQELNTQRCLRKSLREEIQDSQNTRLQTEEQLFSLGHKSNLTICAISDY